MAKRKTVFVCQNCGFESPKWLGKCTECGKWDCMVEEEKVEEKSVPKKSAISDYNSVPKSILDIKSGEYERLDTGIGELNRVLGGGLVKGSLTLISGEPGIGKSTILLQVAQNIASKYGKILYVSGEESEEQIKMRGDRLGADCRDLYVISETNVDIIENNILQLKPVFVVIDSIQTLYNAELSSAPGSVSQVRECANDLMRIGKTNNIPLFIVAHVTKQGELAGPKVLEHIVDTVLSFEGERREEFRVLRTLKNRFGTTSEIGVFSMEGEGLKEIVNPSEVFIEDSENSREGSIVIGIMEGSRPILVEIQALVSETKSPIPRRTAVGVEISRLYLILAVLEKKLRIPFYTSDVYINVVGGLNIDGTFADLGLAAALLSSKMGREPKLNKLLIVGEVGLTSEVRPVNYVDRIVNEGIKMGFTNIVIPARNMSKIKRDDANIIPVSYLSQVINKIFK